ncbi:type III-A CRISPR-associated protein Cas10/Csm1 [Lentilactobacillus parakefiri]|uniref:CRISPR system single-strand-specific deoxyribonuclease Cas10/Csm1 (subtype III-A) n=1 Tax=Lentilactobacillus parakefiri TaxID=152332 RepID=A0A269Y3J5_9LACO|nr:type III-A CRISPR-associated protein Cas10/Csm1 [Lentilactobacillus parakefiri]PAK80122.1 type III-A CRISPR-associated protein Cas10/Csm1 [Lentilactobacillus parakefiri]
MDENLTKLFYGASLHDIGKIVQRATKQRIKHAKLGYDFLRQFTADPGILNQVRFHHAGELSRANLSNNDLAYITYLADNIASGVDRRDNGIEVQQKWNSKTALEDIFNRFGSQMGEKRYFKARKLDLSGENIFAQTDSTVFSDSEYSAILKKIKETLQVIDFDERYIQSVLNLLEATASFVPSSTNMTEVADISLYDHLKLTAGIAAAIYVYLNDQQISDYKKALFDHSQDFYQQKAFLLASFDISGIQDFIYTITSKGAHKQLRSRSFYLDMISEWVVDSLLSACQLTRANLMYSGGGHAYFILPNTAAIKENINQVQTSFDRFFLAKFQTKLYIAFGSAEFAASQVMQGNDLQQYQAIYRHVSQQISQQKLSRYSLTALKQLNEGGKKTGRECVVCHNVDDLVADTNECRLCYALERFSKDIQHDNYFEVNTEASGLQIGEKAYLHKTSLEKIKTHQFAGKIYSKNQLNTGEDQATRLWIGDYTDLANNDFSEYAQRKWTCDENQQPIGIKRIAALRCDVDDLGYAFMAGFSQQNNGIYNTFGRTATFSRSMSIFFKLYINQFAKENKRRLTIVYAGGDDVFILGAWDDVLKFAVELRQNFLKWSNNKLTLSAGIGIFPDKTPIDIIARTAGSLEETAKDNGKDSICLFADRFVFKYDDFINDVLQDKLVVIQNFFANESERGKAFIYKLLDLIRQRDSQDRIAFPRLAYYLARLEDTLKDDAASQQKFSNFKRQMKDWFDDDQQIKAVELALMLYVYEIRKED